MDGLCESRRRCERFGRTSRRRRGMAPRKIRKKCFGWRTSLVAHSHKNQRKKSISKFREIGQSKSFRTASLQNPLAILDHIIIMLDYYQMTHMYVQGVNGLTFFNGNNWRQIRKWRIARMRVALAQHRKYCGSTVRVVCKHYGSKSHRQGDFEDPARARELPYGRRYFFKGLQLFVVCQLPCPPLFADSC